MAEPYPTVVVVDDEKLIREGCARILAKSNYRVFTAENGKEGLDLIIREQAEIALVDLKMPVMDGMTLLKEINERALDTLVIVITGHGTIETAVQSMKRGAYDFITKPFMPDQVRMVLNRAWEMKRLEREAAFLREERARSLRDIATEKSRIANIIQAMADGVIITDQNCEIVLNNAAAARLLGVETNVLRGRPLSEATRNPALSEMVLQVLNPSDPAVTFITREMDVGEDNYARVSSGVVKDEQGNPMGTVTVLQDIGYLKQLEKMKSDFVALVAHELRAPLAAIRQNIDLLKSQTLGPLNAAQLHALERMSDRSGGLLRLIQNLLDLSKLEAGKLVLNKEYLDLKPIIENVVHLLQPHASTRKITITLDLPERLPLILGDPLHLEGVVTNLVSNAIRYNKDQGEVRVRALSEGEFLVLEVSDTGIGISEEELPKIFDRFYRVRSRETRTIVGTGLGLPIVKGIVEAHMGSIEVQSEPGRGTTFRILLPKLPHTPPTSKEGERIDSVPPDR